jgi:hypothetical protein
MGREYALVLEALRSKSLGRKNFEENLKLGKMCELGWSADPNTREIHGIDKETDWMNHKKP